MLGYTTWTLEDIQDDKLMSGSLVSKSFDQFLLFRALFKPQTASSMEGSSSAPTLLAKHGIITQEAFDQAGRILQSDPAFCRLADLAADRTCWARIVIMTLATLCWQGTRFAHYAMECFVLAVLHRPRLVSIRVTSDGRVSVRRQVFMTSAPAMKVILFLSQCLEKTRVLYPTGRSMTAR